MLSLRAFGSRFDLKTYDCLGADEIRKLQEKRLRATVEQAYRQSTFWREWLVKAQVGARDIRGIYDLPKLDICTKHDLVSQPLTERMTSNPADCVKLFETDTASNALDVYCSKDYASDLYVESRHRISRFFGLRPFFRMMSISYEVEGRRVESKPSKNKARRGQALYGGFWFPNLKRNPRLRHTPMSGELGGVVPEIIRYKPEMIYGYPSHLRAFAEWLAEENTEYRPKVLLAGGKPTDEPNRQLIESALGCDVYHGYGATEFGLIALECREKAGMHVMAERFIVEVVRNGLPVSPGERGEIVITSLMNSAMPFLRYGLGDIGYMSRDPCSCGRTTPLLKSVEGRLIDHVVTPDGRTISPKTFLGLMHRVEGLPGCQLVQENAYSFKLRIFKRKSRDIGPPLARFLGDLRELLGPEVQLIVSVEEPEIVGTRFRALVTTRSSSREQRWVRPY
jgi:phenylacetate-CoA ligase